MPDITLGIPLYHSAPFLPELFSRLRAQHVMPNEVVFVDDASPDNSRQLAAQFIESIGSHIRARLVVHPQNLGIAATYNRLVAEASQPWLQILDADDYPVEDDYYDRISNALTNDSDLVITALYGDNGVFKLTRGLERFVPNHPADWWPLLGSFATRSGVIYRRERLYRQTFPDPAFPGSDIIHLLTLRQGRRARFVPAAHVYYRVHPAATSAKSRDYSHYLVSLASFGFATRLSHRLDLRLRQVGQWWTR